MTTNQSPLAAALAPRRARPTVVLYATALVGLQALLFGVLAALDLPTDRATALLLAIGAAGGALAAFGLFRGNRVAYVVTVSYSAVAVTLAAVFDHRPAVAPLVTLLLVGSTWKYFFRR